jgi:uncharacterized linocin/CFP29 family protein
VRSGPGTSLGLVFIERGAGTAEQVLSSQIQLAEAIARSPNVLPAPTPGDHLVVEIANAVVALESASNPGPFACVLSAQAFVAVHTPVVGLVLPVDRITPILNGPLLRSGRMPGFSGIVVSLAANSIDIVVATPPRAQFLNVDQNAKYHFRVYEKFILRIKEPQAVRGIGI